MTEEILSSSSPTPSTLGEPLPAADDYLRAEIVYAASHEGARHLDDVLTSGAPGSPSRRSTGAPAAPGSAPS